MSPAVLGSGLKVALVAGAPFLLLLALVGLVLAVLQSGTGIQDQSATQAARVGVLGVALVLLGPWALRVVGSFTRGLWVDLGRFLY